MKTLSMPRQHDWLLPALALIAFVFGGMLFRIDQRLPETVWEGRDLISGLEPKELNKITFKTNSKTFSLNREGEVFTVDSQNFAPVDMNKLNEILLRLGGIQISQVVGSKEDWDKFNVAEKNAELVVELYSRKDVPQWKIFLGKSISGKPGRAVRVEGKDEIFATTDHLYLNTSDSDFISKEGFKITKSKVINFELLQEGKKLDEKKFIKDDLLSSLEPLRVKAHYRTGAISSDLQDIVWSWQAQILNENGVIHAITWGKKNERWFAKAQAVANQSLDSTSQILDVKLLALKADVDKFNQQKMPWIWELSEESVEKLTRGLMYGEKKKDNSVSKK